MTYALWKLYAKDKQIPLMLLLEMNYVMKYLPFGYVLNIDSIISAVRLYFNVLHPETLTLAPVYKTILQTLLSIIIVTQWLTYE